MRYRESVFPGKTTMRHANLGIAPAKKRRMSLRTQCFSFLAIKPRVWVEGGKLFARASLAVRISSLGAYDRCVIADKGQRVVSVYEKTWWTRRPEVRIPFERVDEIDRSLHRWTTTWAEHGGSYTPHTRWNRNDQVEFFKVSLFLRDPHENVDLFWFWGEGAIETGVAGVLLGSDDVVDFAGDQRATSEQYAKLLSTFTGARVHDFPVQGTVEILDRYAH